MTGAQALEAKGRREGRREMLLEQLEYKFGPLDARVVSAVQALSERRLDDLTKSVLTASSLSELGL